MPENSISVAEWRSQLPQKAVKCVFYKPCHECSRMVRIGKRFIPHNQHNIDAKSVTYSQGNHRLLILKDWV